MKKKYQSLTMVAFVIFVLTCGLANAKESDMTNMVVSDNNRFALDLYAQLKQREGNLFFSPFSISTAMAMTYAGARENTARQMASAMHFSDDQKLQNHAFNRLLTRLNAVQDASDVELRVANALWAQKGYQFLDEFLRVIEQSYRAELSQVDFTTAADAARLAINRWVENETRNKIKDLIQPGVLDALTRMVLVNAIYFKGFWETQFEPEETREMDFWLSAETSTAVPMMRKEDSFAYWENDWLQLVELPYKDESLSLIVLLPKERTGISNLEQQLTQQNTKTWQQQMGKQKVIVFLPKFKIESEFDLSQTLSSMGMPDAFDADRADYTGMAAQKELYLSAVIHKAFVEVNEEGTEAAAATGVVVSTTSIAPPAPIFKADHPFVFMIRDNGSQSILFLGRVSNPTSNE